MKDVAIIIISAEGHEFRPERQSFKMKCVSNGRTEEDCFLNDRTEENFEFEGIELVTEFVKKQLAQAMELNLELGYATTEMIITRDK